MDLIAYIIIGVCVVGWVGGALFGDWRMYR